MPWFRYVATDSEGQRISGEMQADSLEAASTNLESSGLLPVTLAAFEVETVPSTEKERPNGIWLSSAEDRKSACRERV